MARTVMKIFGSTICSLMKDLQLTPPFTYSQSCNQTKFSIHPILSECDGASIIHK